MAEATQRPGNALLSKVFGEGDSSMFSSDLVGHFHPLEPIRDIKRFNPKRLTNLPTELEFEDATPNVIEEISRGNGIHAIAWYLPYRVFGPKKWGIYFDVFAMASLGREVATKARKINSAIGNSESLRVLYASVLRHEIEHAIQELLFAKALRDGYIGLQELPSKNFSRPMSYRETIASHFEHLDELLTIKGIYGSKTMLIRKMLQDVPSPKIYDDWKGSEIQSLDSQYERELNFPASQVEMSDRERSLLAGRARSSYIDIPVYEWFGNGLAINLSGSDLRQVIDCKKFSRLIERGDLGKLFGNDMYPTSSPDHQTQVVNAHTRPIKFGCHDWNSVPDHVLKQFALAAGLTKKEFISRILKEL